MPLPPRRRRWGKRAYCTCKSTSLLTSPDKLVTSSVSIARPVCIRLDPKPLFPGYCRQLIIQLLPCIFVDWLTIGINISGWTQGSALLALGLTAGQAILASILGNLIVAAACVLGGMPGARWHVGFPCVNRAVWGIKGSIFPVRLADRNYLPRPEGCYFSYES